MPSRSRAQTKTSGQGSKYNLQGVLLATVSNLGSSDSITDFVADGDGHNLDIRHLTIRGMVIDEVATTGSISGRRWVNWMPDRIRNPNDSLFGHLVVPDKPTDAILAADLLARTNPSRPVIDLPIAIYELREIPSLLRDEGNKIIRGLAAGHLAVEFGIKPLVNDLKSLLNFSDEVAKRQRELERLHAGGLKRKRDLWSGSITAGPIDIIAQSGDKLTVHMINSKATQCKISGFVRWFPSNPGLMKGDLRDQARKAVLGLTLDFATAWNAIPWSWLVDWCGNVGDILIANRNLVGANHGPVQIMTQTTTTCDSVLTGIGSAKYSKGGYTEVSKRRRSIVHVPVDVQLPVLNLRQLSILGSIGVTRRVPRSS
jgi:hypothetical protein